MLYIMHVFGICGLQFYYIFDLCRFRGGHQDYKLSAMWPKPEFQQMYNANVIKNDAQGNVSKHSDIKNAAQGSVSTYCKVQNVVNHYVFMMLMLKNTAQGSNLNHRNASKAVQGSVFKHQHHQHTVIY